MVQVRNFIVSSVFAVLAASAAFLFSNGGFENIDEWIGFGKPFATRDGLWTVFEDSSTTSSDQAAADSAFGRCSYPPPAQMDFSLAAGNCTNGNKTVVVVGAGFSGLTAALELKRRGFGRVVVLDKNSKPGGRAVSFSSDNGFGEIFHRDGTEEESEGDHGGGESSSSIARFTFDFGPSWYWFPDVFEEVFRRYGKSRSDYYDLKKLEPAYRVFHDSAFSAGEAGGVTETAAHEQTPQTFTSVIDIPSGGDDFVEWVESMQGGAPLAGAVALRLFEKNTN